MKSIIKKSPYHIAVLFLLLGATFLSNNSYADNVRCAPYSNTSNSISAFDFNQLPSQIPDTVPVGTTIYDVTMEVWCAKDISKVASGPQKIYISRDALTNALGSKSGLAFYVTINGERGGGARQSYDSGYTTDVVFLQGLPVSNYTKISVPVRVELVKTGENISLTPLSNDVWLFSIGDAGTGYLRYRAANVKKISFSDYTCDITTPNIHQNLPTINIADLKRNGRLEGYDTDFSLSLNCNGSLWSTLSINMAFNGSAVPGLEQHGVYQYLNNANGVAEGIGFQILHRNDTGDYVESGNGEFFKIGNFSGKHEIVTFPLKVNYYRTSDRIIPGDLKGIVTYTIDYM